MGFKQEKRQTLGIVCLPYHMDSEDNLVLDVTVGELAKLMQENVCTFKVNFSKTSSAIFEIIHTLQYSEGTYTVYSENITFSAASIDDYPTTSGLS